MADGTKHPTGYFAEEALKPYERFVAAGFEVVVVTPDGKAPTADPYGLSWFFHYLDEDKDYLNSVVRTFAFDPDDIRSTLHQATGLDLAASRRLTKALEAKGMPAADAHATISKAGKVAWRQDRRLGDVLADPEYTPGLTNTEIEEAIAAQKKASEELAAERKAKLDAIPGFQRPADLRSLTDYDLGTFDAVFAPGPRPHGRSDRQPGRGEAAGRPARADRTHRVAVPRSGTAPVRSRASGRAVALRRLPDDLLHRRGGGPDGAGQAGPALVCRHRAEERRRCFRRRPVSLGQSRGRRPSPDHRPEPWLDRGRRRRRHQGPGHVIGTGRVTCRS